VLVLFFTVFIDLVGFGIVLPLQPFYAQKFGAAPEIITLVAASFTLTQFMFAPVWGRLSDRIGRRPVLLITIFGTFIGYLWLAFTDSLIMLFAARAFGGAMAANIGVAHAYVADITSPEDRSRGMGRIGAAAGLGFVAGPAIGGLLAGPDPVNPDFQFPFLAAAAFSAAAFVLSVFFLRETLDRQARNAAAALNGSRIAALIDALSRPNMGVLLLLVMMTPFVFSGIETILAIWTEHVLAWGPEQNGYMYAYMGVVAVLVQGLLIGPLTRAFGEKHLIGGGAFTVFLGTLWLPWGVGYASIMGALGLIVAGVCMCGPSLSSLISQHAASHERGRILGVSQSSAGLGRILGPALSGTAFAGLGADSPFYIGAIVMIVMLTLSLWITGHRPAPKSTEID
jgi:MFS transporter, DHA1 family, tetracycline resistance protein